MKPTQPIIRSRRLVYPGADKLINFLVASGLLLGLATMLMDSQALAKLAFIDPKNIYDHMVKPAPYKLLKLIEIACILSAAILAYWTDGRFWASRFMKQLFFVMLIWMTGHAILTFQNDYLPSELISVKGPATWWSLLLLFAGASIKRWNIIYPIIILIVIIGSMEMAYRIFSIIGGFDRVIAQRTLGLSLRLMFWSAPLIFLLPRKKLIKRLLSLVPLVLLSVTSIMTATRSWITICLIYWIFLFYLMLQEVKRPEAKMTVMITVLALAGISFLPIYTLFETQLQTGVNIFLERATEDSRTLQLEQFFANVPLTDLLIGTGPRGLWKMGNTYYGYVDGTYLFLLFVGGVPLLWGYLYLVVYPPIHCLIKKRLSLYGTIDFSCIIMGSIWGLVLTGFSTYTMPELKVNHYIILLCAGRCWFLLKRSPTQQ